MFGDCVSIHADLTVVERQNKAADPIVRGALENVNEFVGGLDSRGTREERQRAVSDERVRLKNKKPLKKNL